jgi:hypothetical protein
MLVLLAHGFSNIETLIIKEAGSKETNLLNKVLKST